MSALPLLLLAGGAAFAATKLGGTPRQRRKAELVAMMPVKRVRSTRVSPRGGTFSPPDFDGFDLPEPPKPPEPPSKWKQRALQACQYAATSQGVPANVAAAGCSKLAEGIEWTADKAEEAYEWMKEQAADAWGEIEDLARDAWGEVEDFANEAWEETKDFIGDITPW